MVSIEKIDRKLASGRYHTDININVNEQKFTISWAGVGDIFWHPEFVGSILDHEQIDIEINSTDGYLYDLIFQLYDDIINYRFVTLDEEQALRIKDVETKNPERLIKNGVIEWHSDDNPYDESSILKIVKQNDKFIISFTRSNPENDFKSLAVRIRMDGTRYASFNFIFNKMYQQLEEYAENEKDYHQITIDEYMMTRKRQLPKK